jgi:hypothetical protein
VNSIWVKIAGAAVAIVLVIVVVGRFSGEKPESGPPQKEKTFYDSADRDKQFGEAPKPAEPAPEQPQQPPAETQAPAQTPAEQPSEPAQQPQPTAQTPGVVLPSSITKATTLYFIPLEETDQIAAEQLLPWAVANRSIGRLPMMQYGVMIKACRDILQRWPESWYAFRAKQMMEEVSQRHAQYNITPQELDISRYLKTRRGAEPFTVEPVQQ